MRVEMQNFMEDGHKINIDYLIFLVLGRKEIFFLQSEFEDMKNDGTNGVNEKHGQV